jgi:hypothetical protein
MLYTLKVYLLIASIVFGVTGAFLLTLLVWNAAQDYARALRAMQRIASGVRRETFANSRSISRTGEMNSRSAV